MSQSMQLFESAHCSDHQRQADTVGRACGLRRGADGGDVCVGFCARMVYALGTFLNCACGHRNVGDKRGGRMGSTEARDGLMP